MANAMDVAGYLVALAAKEPEPELISHLRLQKLLYYVQGWSLAVRARPIFCEQIEAWTFGPVVPRVYQEFKHHGRHPIETSDVSVPESLCEEDKRLIESVWAHYKRFSAVRLTEMTHDEAPWKDARSGFGPNELSSAEVSRESLASFFSSVYASEQIQGLELEKIRQAEADIAKGRAIPIEQLAAHLAR